LACKDFHYGAPHLHNICQEMVLILLTFRGGKYCKVLWDCDQIAVNIDMLIEVRISSGLLVKVMLSHFDGLGSVF